MAAYNAEDRVRWEQYADAFRTWLAKRGPYPGNPPEGYVDVYKVSQRYAPCPHEYAELVAAEHQPAPSIPGVTMTADAFNAFLCHASTVNSQIAGLVQQASTSTSQWDRRPTGGAPRYERANQGGFRRGRGRGRARAHAYNGPLTDRIGEPCPARHGHPTRRGRRGRREYTEELEDREPEDREDRGEREEDATPEPQSESMIDRLLSAIVDALGDVCLADGQYDDDAVQQQQGGGGGQVYLSDVDAEGEDDDEQAAPMAVDHKDDSGFVNLS
ncbi:uncharacterized protein TRAVEDRAFT_24775 [Trametes versicolor FP-101664 SS1]|uniref:Uncharacterized protein n=1 Tax=Trametes versicolor (strain FP-101664) TaxID=717944 RepID=R7SB03_TRAVS|nr:uncharacterized protein TRAVEDRAFT_24775 [Trametes versicolor FP-101664 SS1]EIW52094.1 hypothetical protein TRAVEDRAFT_24775 [Trametes versicolor FP-101664 SS1]